MLIGPGHRETSDARVEDADAVIVATGGKLAGYDIATGNLRQGTALPGVKDATRLGDA